MTFPDLDYSLLGYDILYGYPLADGRDPGFRHPIFTANFAKAKQSSDCRYTYPEGFMVVPSESCVVSFESKLIRNRQQMSEHLGFQANIEGISIVTHPLTFSVSSRNVRALCDNT